MLKLSQVRKVYEGADTALEVLKGIDLEISQGEALAITGPSGSGKSTLLHIIGTLDRPTTGKVLIDGSDPFGLEERELARFRNQSIGFVFQDHHLLPQYSVIENVLLPALAFPGGGNRLQRAHKLLKRVGLEKRTEHRPSQLSGGERQRAAVARALINNPTLVLCDEPTGSLDSANADSVAEALFELHSDQKAVLIAVTHSQSLADRFQRRCMLEGGLLEERECSKASSTTGAPT